MDDKEKMYTSTGMKLIHHPHVVARLRQKVILAPVSLQIAPTSRCNLNCCFCSNVKRKRHQNLDLEEVEDLLLLFSHGTRTVEWTGGGDPTQWGSICEAIEFANQNEYRQGFITNGVDLAEILPVMKYLSWLRISMNCLDYVDSIKIPADTKKLTLGFSYVMNEKTEDRTLDRLLWFTRKYNPSYVRIVPNCQATFEEQEENNRRYSKLVAEMGPPFFYQAKHFSTPQHCWWCYLKPFVLHDGWVYPCSSVVLNESAERQFHRRYRWCRLGDLGAMYRREMEPFNSDFCTHCVFRPQNDLVEDIINPKGMEDFI